MPTGKQLSELEEIKQIAENLKVSEEPTRQPDPQTQESTEEKK